ncbi:MAG: prepilin-type N-terminal cleavage/methylation domain-containing protein [Pseudomonadota bacterium]
MAPTLRRRPRSTSPGGFTLVELITVLVVVGIMAGVAAPRFFQRQGFDALAYTDQLRAMLRYGQKIAIAQGRNVFVRLNGNSVALCYDLQCNAGALVTAPGGANSGTSVTLANCGGVGSWACEGVPNGLTVSSAATFFFDPTGQPFAGTDAPQALNANFVALTLAVTGGDGTHNVTVTPVTGYVF